MGHRVTRSGDAGVVGMIARATLASIIGTFSLLLAFAAPAAADVAVAASTTPLPFGAAGPVGIGAVLVGMGGILAGVVRQRRARGARPQAGDPVPVPVTRAESSADTRSAA